MTLIMSMINEGKKQSAESSCGPPVGNAEVSQFGCCPSFVGEGGQELPSKLLRMK